MRPRNPELSVCMIVRNEAHQLADALENFRSFADEIVVVDTGSTDDTHDLARKYTDRVFTFPWCDDFSAARNHSLTHATGRYVLWMDADDRVDSRMAERLVDLKRVFDGKSAFYFILQDMSASGPSCSFHQLRCAPRLDHVRFRGRIHERLGIQGLTPLTVDIVIQHHGYINQKVHRAKVERNLALLEKELLDGNDDAYIHYYLSLTYEGLEQHGKSIGHMRRALGHIERMIRQHRNATEKQLNLRALMEIHFHLARLHLNLNEQSTALRHATLAQSLGGDDARSLFRLGLIHQQLGRPRQAIRCFQRATVSDVTADIFPSAPLPSLDRLYIHLAFSHLRLGEHGQAMEYMRKSWALGLNPLDGWELLGLLALKAEEWSIARLAYESGLMAGELSDAGNFFLGSLYKQRRLLGKARDCYVRALHQNPNHEKARQGLDEIQAELMGQKSQYENVIQV